MFHPLPVETDSIASPSQFTYPFYYRPHALCEWAAAEVRRYVEQHAELHTDAVRGKMLGVLVVNRREPDGTNRRGFLAAFSGILAGRNQWAFFVPPIYDLQHPESYFRAEEAQIVQLSAEIKQMENHKSRISAQKRLTALQAEANAALSIARDEYNAARKLRKQRRAAGEDESALVRESQFQKGEMSRLRRSWAERLAAEEANVAAYDSNIEHLVRERARRSAALQEWLFGQYVVMNGKGVPCAISELFEGIPPSGSGECCAPKLLHYAFTHELHPVCMAEFWMGESPHDELRIDGNYYPACRQKCRPILRHMLEGLEVEANPLLERNRQMVSKMRIFYADDDLVVLEKPSGMLSVPGNEDVPSVKDEVKRLFPQAEGPMMVHRLDMDTSGVMVVALTSSAYRCLQAQFTQRKAMKRYVACLDVPAKPLPKRGVITLPLSPNPNDRPRQMVSEEHGLAAETHYEVIQTIPTLLLHLFPKTGRTHQLRVHCAHPDGLGAPILGDNLYGTPSVRLLLHAECLKFQHPVTGKKLEFVSPVPF